MTPDRHTPYEPEWIEAYLLGELSDEQVQALDAQLREDPEALEQFAAAIEIMSMVRQEFRGRQEQGSLQSDEPVLRDFDRLFSELLQAEREANTQTVSVTPHADPAAVARADRPSLREAGLVAGYLFTRPAVWGTLAGVAAILVLCAVVFWPQPQPPASPTAEQLPPTPQVPTSTPVVVATLTGQHHARWQHAAPRVGQALTSGQRLVLTQGSAQITTARGAVMILEAPATIELLDSDNAVRLHAGRLVGICETDSSKGFVVRTPQLNITDMGTRFGVDVVAGYATEVHVHQGEIHYALPQAPGSASSLRGRVSAHQAVRMDVLSDGVAAIEPAFEKFSDQLVTRRLFSTGFDLPEGSRDMGWQIVADAKGPLDRPIPLRVQYGEREDNHFAARGNDPALAQWLTYAPGYPLYGDPKRPELDPSTITIQCRFDLPDSVGLENAAIALRYASGYGLTQLRINGTPVQAVHAYTNADRRETPYRQIELPAHTTSLRHGENIIEIDVPRPALKTQAPLVIYFNAELRPSSATPLQSTGENRP